MTSGPVPVLIALVGPAAAGKSSVAARYPSTWVLSLDTYRAALTDDAGDQTATAEAVALQTLVLHARLRRSLPCVVDATNVESRIRVRLLAAAAEHGAEAQAVLLHPPLAVCLARNAARQPRVRVPEATVRWQHARTPTPAQLRAEGFVVLSAPVGSTV